MEKGYCEAMLGRQNEKLQDNFFNIILKDLFNGTLFDGVREIIFSSTLFIETQNIIFLL